jgi:hypothetical protein
MSFLSSLKFWATTTEADAVAFVGNVWAEIPIAASKVKAIANWLANTALPAFQKDLDFAMPVMTTVATASGHAELGASLVALDAATHAVNTAISSAQAGTITADQVVTAIGALSSAKATFNNAQALTAKIVATTPATVAN